jgi:hypothetical protein
MDCPKLKQLILGTFGIEVQLTVEELRQFLLA